MGRNSSLRAHDIKLLYERALKLDRSILPGGWRLFRFMQQEKSELKKERAAKRAVTTRRSKAKRGEKNCTAALEKGEAKKSAPRTPHTTNGFSVENAAAVNLRHLEIIIGRCIRKYVKERKSIEKYTKYDLAKRKSSGNYCRLKRPRRNFPSRFSATYLGIRN